MSHPQALCLHVAPRFPRYSLGPLGLGQRLRRPSQAGHHPGGRSISRPTTSIATAADFKGRGFRLFLDKGAYFEDCYYDYANTKTAPGHATLGTGAYTDGHGISANSWWDLTRNKTRPVILGRR